MMGQAYNLFLAKNGPNLGSSWPVSYHYNVFFIKTNEQVPLRRQFSTARRASGWWSPDWWCDPRETTSIFLVQILNYNSYYQQLRADQENDCERTTKNTEVTDDSFVSAAQDLPQLPIWAIHSKKRVCLPPTHPQEHFLTQECGRIQEEIESGSYFNKVTVSSNNASGTLLGTWKDDGATSSLAGLSPVTNRHRMTWVP